ncbi:MAG: ImmA/IrrE family metallo-endopeptidase [Solibacillus sp.]|uniref:ImmA/IrrE family metallo-endopeptidase n=1 Tax=Solibacillus sp. FSL R7-0682 TaxID=2921690 RepID=UPI0030FC8FB3
MWIKQKTNQLKERYKTDCPYQLAKCLNVHVVFHNLHPEINGYYKYDRRNKYIVINSNLDDKDKKSTCAHELGHVSLHPRVNTPLMRRDTFLSVSKIEREANQFAAELLISDESLLKCQNEQMTMQDIALLHNVPLELVELKCKKLFFVN